jgi:hypothetical protein
LDGAGDCEVEVGASRGIVATVEIGSVERSFSVCAGSVGAARLADDIWGAAGANEAAGASEAADAAFATGLSAVTLEKTAVGGVDCGVIALSWTWSGSVRTGSSGCRVRVDTETESAIDDFGTGTCAGPAVTCASVGTRVLGGAGASVDA